MKLAYEFQWKRVSRETVWIQVIVRKAEKMMIIKGAVRSFSWGGCLAQKKFRALSAFTVKNGEKEGAVESSARS